MLESAVEIPSFTLQPSGCDRSTINPDLPGLLFLGMTPKRFINTALVTRAETGLPHCHKPTCYANKIGPPPGVQMQSAC